MSKWFIKLKLSEIPRRRIFCFPCAGGLASSYKSWIKLLPDDTELYASSLPGRGERIDEKSVEKIDVLLRGMFFEFLKLLNLPYIFIGHSLGGIIAFELIKIIQKCGYPCPKRLIIAGREYPSYICDTPLHDKPDSDILQYLKSVGGTPDHILENKDLINTLMPSIRADFKLDETHHEYYLKNKFQIKCPISVYYGSKETIKFEDLDGWKQETLAEYKINKIRGDHFFIFDEPNLFFEQVLSEFE